MSKLKLFFCSLFLILSFPLLAQLPSLPSDLSGVKSSDVSDEQLQQIADYLQRNNVSSEQAYNLLTSRGMVVSEANILKSRLEKVKRRSGKSITDSDSTGANPTSRYNTNDNNNRSDTTNPNTGIKNLNPKKIFGLEIFNNGVLSFEPNFNIATLIPKKILMITLQKTFL